MKIYSAPIWGHFGELDISNLINNSLIEAIYEGPLEELPWQELASLLRERFSAVCTGLYFRLPSETGNSFDVSDADWDIRIMREQYESRYYHLNPFDFEAMKAGKACRWSDYLSRDKFHESEFYKGFCQPQGLEYACCMRVDSPEGLSVWVSVARARSEGDFTASEFEALESLNGHIERALRIMTRLQGWQLDKLATQVAVEHMAIGAILLDDSGCVINANDAAKSISLKSQFFSIAKNRLVLSDRSKQQQYISFVNKLLSTSEPDTSEALSLGGNPEVHVGMLLRRYNHEKNISHKQRPAIIIYITESSSHALVPTQLVAQLFGLTKTEARLAVILADGLTLKDAAESMDVTESTCRSYCKRIFAKMGVSRQADIVRLVLKSVASLA